MKKVVEIWKVTWPNSINLLQTRWCPGHLTVLQHGDGTQSIYKAGTTQTLADSTPKNSLIKVKMSHTMLLIEPNGARKRKDQAELPERRGGPAPPTNRPELRHTKGHLDKSVTHLCQNRSKVGLGLIHSPVQRQTWKGHLTGISGLRQDQAATVHRVLQVPETAAKTRRRQSHQMPEKGRGEGKTVFGWNGMRGYLKTHKNWKKNYTKADTW